MNKATKSDFYLPAEEKVNIINHVTGLALSIVALVLLVTRASLHGNAWIGWTLFVDWLVNRGF